LSADALGAADSEVSMRSIRPAVVMALALLAVPAIATPQPSGPRSSVSQSSSQSRRNVHQEYDRSTDTTFVSTTDANGNALFTVKVGDFLLEKVLAASGDMTLRLTQGKDIVTIAMNQSGYQVARGRRSGRFDPRSERTDGRDAIRSVLLGSPAVRTFRRLNAALENRDENEEDGPLLLSALVDGAMVQMLDGDPGATKRIGKRVTRKREAALRAVKLAPDTFRDCIALYEIALLDAWNLYWKCAEEASGYTWWLALWAEAGCEFEWLVRSQQYLWQFAGCSAFPF
jgi:hypothetical protein